MMIQLRPEHKRCTLNDDDLNGLLLKKVSVRFLFGLATTCVSIAAARSDPTKEIHLVILN